MITWEDLTKTDANHQILSTVYGACMTPMINKEIVEFIYGKGKSRIVNNQAVIDAIKNLEEAKFSDRVHTGGFEGKFKIRSTYLPLFQYSKNHIQKLADVSDKLDYPQFNKDQERIFELIFNSRWFRTLFSPQEIKNPNGFNRSHTFSLEKKNRVVVYDSLGMMAEILERIGGITFTLSKDRDIRKLLPTEKDFEGVQGFDIFSDKWIENIKTNNPTILHDIDKILMISTEYLSKSNACIAFLGHMINKKAFLCIPYDLSRILICIKRCQSTYPIAIEHGLFSVKNGRKVSPETIKVFKKGGNSWNPFE